MATFTPFPTMPSIPRHGYIETHGGGSPLAEPPDTGGLRGTQEQKALLTALAGRLAAEIARQALKRSTIIQSPSTLRNLLKGRNVTLRTLLDVADGVNLDVDIVLRPRL